MLFVSVERLEGALAALLLTLLPCALLWPALRGGSIPLELDGIYFAPPWEAARPAGLEAPPEGMGDATRLYPWYRFMNEAGRRGHLPLWNPYEALGAPFLALWRTRALSPFSIPVYVLPLALGLAWSALLKLIAAGACAYYAARRFGFHPCTALLCALGFQWSGPMLGWLAHPVADAAVWLPLWWLAVERMAIGQSAAWRAGAVVLAPIGLGGAPEALAAAVAIAAAYVPLRRTLQRPPVAARWRPYAALALAIGAGALLLGAQLVPYFEYLGAAARGLHRESGPPLAALWCLAFPALAPPAAAAHGGGMLFPGLAALLLLPVWLAVRPYAVPGLRARLEAFALIAAAAAAAGLVLGRLPLPGRLGEWQLALAAAWPLAMAFLAAGAVEEWIDLGADEMRAALRRLAWALPACWCGIALAAAAAALGGAPAALPAALLAASALLLALLLGRTLVRPRLRPLAYAACTIAVAGGYLAFAGRVPMTPETAAFPETPFIESLRAMKARIAGSRTLRDWPLAGNGLEQVFAPGGSTLARYEAFLAQTARDPLLLRRMGAGALLLTKEDIQGPFAALRPALNIAEVFPSGAILFRDLQARPRARMIYAARNVDAFDPAQLDPHQSPLLETATLPESGDGREAVAAVTVDRPEHIEVRLEKTRPGVLVLADAYCPGWVAAVDGRPAPIVPVDGLFRGVEVGEGEHTVLFEYRPRAVRLGALLSILGVLVISIHGRIKYRVPGFHGRNMR